MKIFISHSFDDDARFDDLCYSLKNENVPYWHPSDLRGGASLREQLRKAINTCDCCIFLATKNSIKSDWCSAELGAFWGVGKKVIVYVADDGLKNEELPEQFKGDIWFRKIRDVIQEAKETLEEVAASRQAADNENNSSPKVADVSVGTLIELIRSVVGGSEPVVRTLTDKMDGLFSLINARVQDPNNVDSDVSAILGPRIKSLIGEPIDGLKSYGKGVWPVGFSVKSSTGKWTGYARKLDYSAGGDVEIYTGCLLMRFRGGCIDAVVVSSRVVEIGIEQPTRYTYEPVIAKDGAGDLGDISSIGTFSVSEITG